MTKRIRALDKHPSRPVGSVWTAPQGPADEMIKKGWAELVVDNPKPVTNQKTALPAPPGASAKTDGGPPASEKEK